MSFYFPSISCPHLSPLHRYVVVSEEETLKNESSLYRAICMRFSHHVMTGSVSRSLRGLLNDNFSLPCLLLSPWLPRRFFPSGNIHDFQILNNVTFFTASRLYLKENYAFSVLRLIIICQLIKFRDWAIYRKFSTSQNEGNIVQMLRPEIPQILKGSFLRVLSFLLRHSISTKQLVYLQHIPLIGEAGRNSSASGAEVGGARCSVCLDRCSVEGGRVDAQLVDFHSSALYEWIESSLKNLMKRDSIISWLRYKEHRNRYKEV